MISLKRFSLFIFLLSGLFFTSCSDMEYPVFQKIENLKLAGVNIIAGKVDMTGDATFFNPNDVGVDISKIDLDVFAEGKKVANISQDVQARMKANSDFTLPIRAKLDIKDLIGNGEGSLKDRLSGLLKKEKKEIEIRTTGKIWVKVLGSEIEIPCDYTEKYELKL